jgi:hypothetical protein
MSESIEIVRSAMNDDAVAIAATIDALLKDRILDKLADKQQEIMHSLYNEPEEAEEIIDIPDLDDADLSLNAED